MNPKSNSAMIDPSNPGPIASRVAHTLAGVADLESAQQIWSDYRPDVPEGQRRSAVDAAVLAWAEIAETYPNPGTVLGSIAHEVCRTTFAGTVRDLQIWLEGREAGLAERGRS